MPKSVYQRILLKVSGEGFSAPGSSGISKQGLETLCQQIGEVYQQKIQIALVVGAGNLIRGATLCENTPLRRCTADQMGMLATMINALALRDSLEAVKIPAKVLSAYPVRGVCDPFDNRRADEYLAQGQVVILAGGTGNPFFTTDTCAALRACEIDAQLLIKATKVDGVFSADPVTHPDAKKFDSLSYTEVLHQDLAVMDHTAISLCRQNQIDILVCNLMQPGTLARAVRGEKIGTLITDAR